jgi:hypothetical protein
MNVTPSVGDKEIVNLANLKLDIAVPGGGTHNQDKRFLALLA